MGTPLAVLVLVAACGGADAERPAPDAASDARAGSVLDEDAFVVEDVDLATDDGASGYGLTTCHDQQCLHGCRPYPRDVLVLGSAAHPLADLYCEDNASSADEPCGACARSAVLRVERRPASGTDVDAQGDEGLGITVAYSASGVWPVVGPGLERQAGSCYRTAVQVVLANGYEASWSHGHWACF